MYMPFGKFKGDDLRDVPTNYLEYQLGWDKLRDPLKTAIEEELQRRLFLEANKNKLTPDLVAEVAEAGRRSLAKKYHPDTGGSHEKMLAINVATDWIRSQARTALP